MKRLTKYNPGTTIKRIKMYKKRKMLRSLSKPPIIQKLKENKANVLKIIKVQEQEYKNQDIIDHEDKASFEEYEKEGQQVETKPVKTLWKDLEYVSQALTQITKKNIKTTTEPTENKNTKNQTKTTNQLDLLPQPFDDITNTQPAVLQFNAPQETFTDYKMKEIEEILSSEQTWKDSEATTPKKQTEKPLSRAINFTEEQKGAEHVLDEATFKTVEMTQDEVEQDVSKVDFVKPQEKVEELSIDQLQEELEEQKMDSIVEEVQPEIQPEGTTEQQEEEKMDLETDVELVHKPVETIQEPSSQELPEEKVSVFETESQENPIIKEDESICPDEMEFANILKSYKLEVSPIIEKEVELENEVMEQQEELPTIEQPTEIFDQQPIMEQQETEKDESENDVMEQEEEIQEGLPTIVQPLNKKEETQEELPTIEQPTETVNQQPLMEQQETEEKAVVEQVSVEQDFVDAEKMEEIQEQSEESTVESIVEQPKENVKTAEDVFEKAIKTSFDFSDSVNFPQKNTNEFAIPTSPQKQKKFTSRHSNVDKRQWKKLNTPKSVSHPYKAQSATTRAPHRKELKFQNVTIPQPFRLSTSSRRESLKSSSELESERLERIRANPFKAKELDPKIYPNAHNIESKLFNFDFRKFQRDLQEKQDEKEGFNFSLTKAKSPPLSFKQRPNFLSKSTPPLFNEKKEFKAKPLPNFSNYQPLNFEVKTFTQAEPFNLQTEKRNSVNRKSLGFEEKPKKFKAKPIMVYEGGVCNVEPIPRTEPKTPRLSSLFLHEQSKQKMKENLENLEREEKKKRMFKASPLPDFESMPLTKQLNSLPLTQILNVELNSEKRAEQRKEFDFKLNEKHKMMEEERRKQEEERQRLEEIEIQKLRKSQEVKANPMPIFEEPTRIEKSDKPLTEPKAPLLLTDFRKRIF
eukprot:gene10632-3255_t